MTEEQQLSRCTSLLSFDLLYWGSYVTLLSTACTVLCYPPVSYVTLLSTACYCFVIHLSATSPCYLLHVLFYVIYLSATSPCYLLHVTVLLSTCQLRHPVIYCMLLFYVFHLSTATPPCYLLHVTVLCYPPVKVDIHNCNHAGN